MLWLPVSGDTGIAIRYSGQPQVVLAFGGNLACKETPCSMHRLHSHRPNQSNRCVSYKIGTYYPKRLPIPDAVHVATPAALYRRRVMMHACRCDVLRCLKGFIETKRLSAPPLLILYGRWQDSLPTQGLPYDHGELAPARQCKCTRGGPMGVPVF